MDRLITRRTHGAAVTIQINPITLEDGTRKPRSMESLVVGEMVPGGPVWSQPVPDDIAEVITKDAGLSKLLKVSALPAPAAKSVDVPADSETVEAAGKSGKKR